MQVCSKREIGRAQGGTDRVVHQISALHTDPISAGVRPK